jgi:tyrosine-protein phosphatase SIW14
VNRTPFDKWLIGAACALVAVMAVGCSSTIPGPLVTKGIPNFVKVDDHVLRGAQPSANGYEELARMGVVTVIDLRQPWERPPSRQEAKAEVEQAHMIYVSNPLNGFSAPSKEQAQHVLNYLSQPTRGSVFIHCEHGADRTGTIIALYRITHDCWTADAAIHEARSYGMAWFEFGMRRFIRQWYENAKLQGCTPAKRESMP